jgi:hypothetical protein
MITPQELRQNSILPWNEIQPRYNNPSLLLGNGFSLQFSQNFSYNSLFNLFLQNCDPIHQQLFAQFGTTNFELIQKYLIYAHRVNTILGLPVAQIETAIENLKTGLIRTIENVHPRVENINFHQLSQVAEQLKDFGDIYTTNYDLYLYHIIMQSIDISRRQKGYVPYQDYYWSREAPAGFRKFVPSQAYVYKHLYYLHGSLCVFKNEAINVKLIRDNDGIELVDLISAQIRNNHIPLFVSEGSGAEKQVAISENNYLTFCIDKLKASTNAVVIFGNMLGDFDAHILNAIKYNPKDIIYCIYIGNRAIADVNAERFNFLAKFNNYNNEIVFVDSSTVFKI